MTYLLHFLKIKRCNINVDLHSFLFNVDQNAQLSLLTYLRVIQFSCTEIGSFPDDFMSLNDIHSLHTSR